MYKHIHICVFMILSILDTIKEPTKWITPSITQLNNGFYHQTPERFLIGTVCTAGIQPSTSN